MGGVDLTDIYRQCSGSGPLAFTLVILVYDNLLNYSCHQASGDSSTAGRGGQGKGDRTTGGETVQKVKINN